MRRAGQLATAIIWQSARATCCQRRCRCWRALLRLPTGGRSIRPQIVRQIVDSNGGLQRDFTPEVVRELPVDDETIRLVRQGMWSAVNSPGGTAFEARMDGVEVAGKTGTAEFCEYIPEKEDCRRDDEDNLPTHAWFTAFAPYDDPEIAVVVFVYDGGEGSAAAAPVAKTILETYFSEVSPR